MITVVTVTYNAEGTLGRTLESVARQSYRDIEHLIIDGGSKDGTVALAEAYRDANPDIRVVIVSEKDRGLYDAMNKGVRMAHGDFMVFLNAGDKLHGDDTLAHVAEQCEKGGVGIVYGDTDIVDDSGRRIGNRHLLPPEHLMWKSFRNGMLVCHQSFYVNRIIALEYDLSYRFSADFDWCIRCMKEGECLGLDNIYLREPLTDYLSEGMTTANHKASLNERMHIMAKHYGWPMTLFMHATFVFRALRRKL